MLPPPANSDLKPGNAARTVWRRGDRAPTPLAVLYLHGFTASPGEAGSLPEQIASELDANLYVHRWPGHGLRSPDAMRGLTLETLRASALDALRIAGDIGGRVAIVGSSMGASLGLWLAATCPAQVASVVAWSPGIQAADPALLDRFCAEQVALTDPRPRTPASLAFWSVSVHPDGYRALRDLFRSQQASPPWPAVRCPVFLGYWRDASGGEDQTASVPAMLAMFDALGTPPSQRRAVAFAAGAHVIGSPHKTPLAAHVAEISTAFLQQKIPVLSEDRIGQQHEVKHVQQRVRSDRAD